MFYFNNGKAITSRMLEWSVRSMTSLSNPIPIPPVGGIPYSRAVIKSSSTETCIQVKHYSRSYTMSMDNSKLMRVSLVCLQTVHPHSLRTHIGILRQTPLQPALHCLLLAVLKLLVDQDL